MIRAFTTFDIRAEPGQSNRFSLKNWNTLTQIANLRCQIDIVTTGRSWTDQRPELISDWLAETPVYYFEFISYDQRVFSSLSDPLHYLKSDSNNVPMVVATGKDDQYVMSMLSCGAGQDNIAYQLI
jgi:hypothetical protein